MKQLLDFASEIAREVRSISPNNSLLCGITTAGELMTDEAVGDGSFFRSEDVIEQIQIRGGTPYPAIQMRLAMLSE